MKQLLVFAGDVGDRFFKPSTLPCFDKVAVKDRNLDSDFKDIDNHKVCNYLYIVWLQDSFTMNLRIC